jgi:hypothetical protein
MIWRRKVSRAANPDREHTVVSPDNQDKANRAASLDNTNRRRVAKVKLKQMKTKRIAIVSVALHSFSTALFIGQLEVPAWPGLPFV